MSRTYFTENFLANNVGLEFFSVFCAQGSSNLLKRLQNGIVCITLHTDERQSIKLSLHPYHSVLPGVHSSKSLEGFGEEGGCRGGGGQEETFLYIDSNLKEVRCKIGLE